MTKTERRLFVIAVVCGLLLALIAVMKNVESAGAAPPPVAPRVVIPAPRPPITVPKPVTVPVIPRSSKPVVPVVSRRGTNPSYTNPSYTSPVNQPWFWWLIFAGQNNTTDANGDGVITDGEEDRGTPWGVIILITVLLLGVFAWAMWAMSRTT